MSNWSVCTKACAALCRANSELLPESEASFGTGRMGASSLDNADLCQRNIGWSRATRTEQATAPETVVPRWGKRRQCGARFACKALPISSMPLVLGHAILARVVSFWLVVCSEQSLVAGCRGFKLGVTNGTRRICLSVVTCARKRCSVKPTV